jgi:hypothetical protein
MNILAVPSGIIARIKDRIRRRTIRRYFDPQNATLPNSFPYRIGCLVYTHNRVDDARVQMRVLQEIWAPAFKSLCIVHAFNGEHDWWPEKQGEDQLLRRENTGHYQGAADLVDAGIKQLETIGGCDYYIVLAADTWFLNPRVIGYWLTCMEEQRKTFAAAPWGNPYNANMFDLGLSGDFFIIEAEWQKMYGMFPVKFGEFRDKYEDVVRYLGKQQVSYEKCLLMAYSRACAMMAGDGNNLGCMELCKEQILALTERMPVHNADWKRNFDVDEISMYGSHDFTGKLEQIRDKYGDVLASFDAVS